MKRKLLFVFTVILTANAVTGQVGLNTATPKTTLDVNAKRDTNGSITDNTQLIGLQAPRLTRAELTNNTATYGTDQKGALVYITDISSGTAIGQRINITATGYYYFDGTIWVKVANSSATAAILPQTVLIASGKTITPQAFSTNPIPLDVVALITNDVSLSGNIITINTTGTYKFDAVARDTVTFSAPDDTGIAETFVNLINTSTSQVLGTSRVPQPFPITNVTANYMHPFSCIGTFVAGTQLNFTGGFINGSTTSPWYSNVGFQITGLQVQRIQ